MIFDPILTFISARLAELVGLLPTCAGLGWDFSGLGALSPYLTSMGLFIDLPTIATVAGLILATEALLWAFRFALFIWRLTPFSG